jgi:hypothetical protein
MVAMKAVAPGIKKMMARLPMLILLSAQSPYGHPALPACITD